MPKALTLEEVKNIFFAQGCKFLDNEYINANHPHNFECVCGNISKTRVGSFKTGRRCQLCANNKKHELNYIKNYFHERNCEFLDDFYINAQHLYNYKCSCGRKSKIRFNNFKKGRRCKDCRGEKLRKEQAYSLETVKNIFRTQGCEFLDEVYINNGHKHKYKCKCGFISKITLAHFQNGRRCGKCAKNGFDPSKKAYLYLVGNHYRQKIGIMGEHTDRLKQHNKNFGLDLIDKMFFENGSEAYELEQSILQKLKTKNILHGEKVFPEKFDGHTESWLLTDLEVAKIQDLIDL